jgi:starch phosphorylase
VGLAEMGLDLRWYWSHANDPLWERLDPELWNLTCNPWLILQTISSARFKALVGDADFRKQLNEQVMVH